MFNQDFEHHSDPFDVSVAQQERILEAQLSHRKPEGPSPTGFCLDPCCGEQLVSDDELERFKNGTPFPAGTRRWCNADCRESWEREKRALARGK